MNEMPTNPQEQRISPFMERAADVFAAPSKLFGEVAAAPVQPSSWLIPYLLLLIFTVITAFVILSDQTLKEQALEPQQEAMQQRVDRGEMTQAEMERAQEMMESSTMATITGVVVSVISVSVSMFAVPLVFWLAIKLFFKANAPYKKVLEIYGLSSVIGVVNVIVTLLLMNLFVSIIASPGASLLLLGSFERGNIAHSVIASLNILSIWQMAVFGLGLAKISNKSAGAGIGASLGLWMAWVLIVSLIGFLMK